MLDSLLVLLTGNTNTTNRLTTSAKH